VRATVGVWGRLVAAGFRRQSSYRLALLAGLFTNVVFGFIRAAVLFAAVDTAGGHLAGYTTGTISAYIWLSQGLLGAVQLNGLADIGDRVRTGDVAVDFTRPVDLQTWHLAEDLGRAAYTLIPRGLPSVLVGALTVGLTLPTTVMPWALGLLSVVLGSAISFYCRFAVNVLGFWLLDTRGVRTFYMILSSFLAGLFVPVGLFPGWLRTVASLTPFPSILQAPVDVLSGHAAGRDALHVVGVQLVWVVATCAAGRVLTTAGRTKLVVQGG
jgi:ABC-2 type transport system permease protein